MVPKVEKIRGYEDFRKYLDLLSHLALGSPKHVNVYFTGSKNENGESWCPDCNVAEPYVMNAFNKYAQLDSVFVIVDVGGRDFWKDRSNAFRKDSDFQVSVIPTLARWKNVVRLDGEQCNNPDLLEMFFTED